MGDLEDRAATSCITIGFRKAAVKGSAVEIARLVQGDARPGRIRAVRPAGEGVQHGEGLRLRRRDGHYRNDEHENERNDFRQVVDVWNRSCLLLLSWHNDSP